MNLRNHVQLIGNLGSDPRIYVFKNNVKVAKFSVATTEFFGSKGKETTQWFTVVAWNKVAEVVEKRCSKGTEVVILGKLRNNNYTDKRGVKRYDMEIHVEDIICRPRVNKAS